MRSFHDLLEEQALIMQFDWKNAINPFKAHYICIHSFLGEIHSASSIVCDFNGLLSITRVHTLRSTVKFSDSYTKIDKTKINSDKW